MQNNIELPWRPVDSRGLARSCCPMLSSLYVYNISNTDFMIATYFNSLFVSSVSSQFNYRSCNRHHHQSIYQSIINQSSSINHHQSLNHSIIICKYSSIMFLFTHYICIVEGLISNKLYYYKQRYKLWSLCSILI